MKLKQAAILTSLGLGLVGIGAVGGATLSRSAAIGAPAEDKHPHMHNAMRALEDARKNLEEASDTYKGHRLKAHEHVEAAMDEIAAGVDEIAPEHHHVK
jgi:hypothetical protein